MMRIRGGGNRGRLLVLDSSPQPDPAPAAIQDEAVGALKLGLVVNGAMAVSKIGVGWGVGSPALLADGYHSVGDVLTGGLGWLSYRWAQAPPDEDHHYGHGKYESLGAALVGGLLVATGVTVAWRALESAAGDYRGQQLVLAALAAFVSILGNEYLARVQGKAAERSGSATLEAMAKDNRSDSASSALVIVGVLSGWLGVAWIEPIVTMIIGLMVLGMGLATLRDSVGVLTDQVPDTDLRPRVRELALEVEGVIGVQSVAIHPLGAFLRADLEISVDGDLSVRKGHEIAHEVSRTVTRGEEEVVEVSVHVNPAG